MTDYPRERFPSTLTETWLAHRINTLLVEYPGLFPTPESRYTAIAQCLNSLAEEGFMVATRIFDPLIVHMVVASKSNTAADVQEHALESFDDEETYEKSIEEADRAITRTLIGLNLLIQIRLPEEFDGDGVMVMPPPRQGMEVGEGSGGDAGVFELFESLTAVPHHFHRLAPIQMQDDTLVQDGDHPQSQPQENKDEEEEADMDLEEGEIVEDRRVEDLFADTEPESQSFGLPPPDVLEPDVNPMPPTEYRF